MRKKTNWLEQQLREAQLDWKRWPQWMKDCSRTGEYLKSIEKETKNDE